MKSIFTIIFMVFALFGAALAHTGVKNAAVMARMDAMSEIGAQMKTLAQMAKGVIDFDQTAARAAAATISKHAAATPELFKAQEDDPMSEAKASIWDSYDDFIKMSHDLEQVARGLSTSIENTADIGPALKSLGATCLSCHKAYRE